MFPYLGSRNPAGRVDWSIIGATVCRYLFVAGVLAFPTIAKLNPVRFIGAGGTYTFGLILACAMLVA